MMTIMFVSRLDLKGLGDPDANKDGLFDLTLGPRETVRLVQTDLSGRAGVVIHAHDQNAVADDLVGSVDGDTLYAYGGDDALDGLAGDDILHGGAGEDDLRGRTGDEVRIGCDAADGFIFADGSGADVIGDFDVELNGETIDLLDVTGVSAFGDLTLVQSGSDTLISWGGGDSILLEGVNVTALSAGDFIF